MFTWSLSVYVACHTPQKLCNTLHRTTKVKYSKRSRIELKYNCSFTSRYVASELFHVSNTSSKSFVSNGIGVFSSHIRTCQVEWPKLYSSNKCVVSIVLPQSLKLISWCLKHHGTRQGLDNLGHLEGDFISYFNGAKNEIVASPLWAHGH